MTLRTATATLLLSLSLVSAAFARPLRVMSVDQCSDQFVLALAPRSEIVGVSPHAFDTDAWLRKDARGLTVRRPTLEEALAAHPDVVVSYWTADGRLADALQAHGAQVVRIEDAHDFDGEVLRQHIRRCRRRALGRKAARQSDDRQDGRGTRRKPRRSPLGQTAARSISRRVDSPPGPTTSWAPS